MGGRMPRQSSSLSFPREYAGDEEPEELDLDSTVLGSRLCMMPCILLRYSSSDFTEAMRAAV
jgi:hypothetical protein